MPTDPHRRVLLLATGDTIAHDLTHHRVATGTDLLATLPTPPACTVTAHDVPAPPSWDTTTATMLALARRTRTAILNDGFHAVVITHGIDTIEETAYLIDLLAADATTHGTIVLTGATTTLDTPSTDGPANLHTALTAATDPTTRGLGALVCANGDLHAARRAHLADATTHAGLTSAPHPPLARVINGRVEQLTTPPPRPPAPTGDPEPDVALIKTYPDMPAALLTCVVDAGARGVVLEGTGAGNVPVELFATIDELTSWDIPVVVASRCHTTDTPLADLPGASGLAATVGAISAHGLSPVKARIALMVALGGGGVTAARDWFDRL
ncbi:asparaginase [Micromonospora sp. CPCC 206060]|uniref:asparaginase n=1 Tax=Micromonospora sp. CPCC 206060 TaxID=3122406 RepID=UPI002FF0E827